MRVAKAKAKAKKKQQKQQQQSSTNGGSSSSSGTGATGGTGGVTRPTPGGNRITSNSVPRVRQPSVPKAPVPATKPPSVPKVLSRSAALAKCAADGLVNNPLSSTDPFDKCVFNLTH